MKTVNTKTYSLSMCVLAAASLALGALGCAASPECRQGPKDDVAMAGRTAGDAVKTGAQTGVEGVRTAGKTVKGAWEGGAPGAAAEWNEGKQETKDTARGDAAQTRVDAELPACR